MVAFPKQGLVCCQLLHQRMPSHVNWMHAVSFDLLQLWAAAFSAACCPVCHVHHLCEHALCCRNVSCVLMIIMIIYKAGMSARLTHVISLSSAVLPIACTLRQTDHQLEQVCQQQLKTVLCKPCYQRSRADSVGRSVFQPDNKLYHMASTTLANSSWRWCVSAAILKSRHLQLKVRS